jgi:uncharacterized protein YcaQ
MFTITNRQARQFILLKHGLLGKHRFIGKQGVLEFIKQAGCVQFDPVDVCGRNADISLNSRVKGYSKQMLDELLYKDRQLIDHFDKNLSIFAIDDLPAFFNDKLDGGYAETYGRRGGGEIKQIEPLIRGLIEKRGHICAAEIDVDKTIKWSWGTMVSLPRAALESMYHRGELIIHHKTGIHKSYALPKDHIPVEILSADPPFNNEEERLAWRVKRRIGAVGMLWNKASDAWLGLGLKSVDRAIAFRKLLEDQTIIEIMVEGIKDPLYIRDDDKSLMDKVLSSKVYSSRAEFIAPLDSVIWDRALIKAIFDFEYKWEIYTPAEKRTYGAYVLPVLYRDRFVGRIEVICDRKTKTLLVKNIWYEDNVKRTKKLRSAVDTCIRRFARFNEMDYKVIALADADSRP